MDAWSMSANENTRNEKAVAAYVKYLTAHYPSTYKTLEEMGSLDLFLRDVAHQLRKEKVISNKLPIEIAI